MSHVISGSSSSRGPLKSNSSHQFPGMHSTINIYFSQVTQSSQAQSMSYNTSPRNTQCTFSIVMMNYEQYKVASIVMMSYERSIKK